jgi:hypothetical protein
MMADSGAVDAAVFAALGADPTLRTLCPDGVWRNQAPQSRTRFVVVILSGGEDANMFHGPAFETFVYAITAVLKDQSSVNASSAAHQIQTVMQALANPTGYVLTVSQRTEPIRYSEPDPVNPDLFWQHFGGLYEVMVEPA